MYRILEARVEQLVVCRVEGVFVSMYFSWLEKEGSGSGFEARINCTSSSLCVGAALSNLQLKSSATNFNLIAVDCRMGGRGVSLTERTEFPTFFGHHP